MYNVQGRHKVTVKVSKKGWVVIPAELRHKYDIKPGMEMHVVDYGGVLALIPASADPIKESAGVFADGPSMIKELLEERKKAREREQ